MIAIPDIQTIRFGKQASFGTLYIHTAGNNPLDAQTPCYADYAGTDSISTYPIKLDYNGLPVHPDTGDVLPTLYVDFSYSLQILDKDGVELFSTFISSDV